MRIKTVKVVGENGEPLIINEDAYDPEVHELCDGEEVAEESDSDPDSEPDSEEENEVETKHHGGGRWSVIVNGVRVNEEFLKKAEAMALAAEY